MTDPFSLYRAIKTFRRFGRVAEGLGLCMNCKRRKNEYGPTCESCERRICLQCHAELYLKEAEERKRFAELGHALPKPTKLTCPFCIKRFEAWRLDA